MDVAIRVANWLVAYDLFRAYGANFDSEFETTFTRSVYEHGLNIINNLEWARGQRGNHYFSDILGLLFVASYLPRTSEVDAWLLAGCLNGEKDGRPIQLESMIETTEITFGVAGS